MCYFHILNLCFSSRETTLKLTVTLKMSFDDCNCREYQRLSIGTTSKCYNGFHISVFCLYKLHHLSTNISSDYPFHVYSCGVSSVRYKFFLRYKKSTLSTVQSVSWNCWWNWTVSTTGFVFLIYKTMYEMIIPISKANVGFS